MLSPATLAMITPRKLFPVSKELFDLIHSMIHPQDIYYDSIEESDFPALSIGREFDFNGKPENFIYVQKKET